MLTWWILFNVFVLAMLALDLLVFHRKTHEVKLKEALIWSGVWVALAAAFNAWIFLDRGSEAGMMFLTGYLIEKSLSIDNVFVFAMIFSYFAVPKAYQHKVLFWGILGALVFRAIFIFAGIALIEKFAWMTWVFGGLLIATGLKMWMSKDKQMNPERNPALRVMRRFMPVSNEFDGERFTTRINGRWAATPLLVTLVLIETSDIIFAVDSIPAILAVTTDPFLVYTANVFAILGLRALYHALAGVLDKFHHLHYGLALILAFVGGKMLAHAAFAYKMPVGLSLSVIAGILSVSIAASLLWPNRKSHQLEHQRPPILGGSKPLPAPQPCPD